MNTIDDFIPRPYRRIWEIQKDNRVKLIIDKFVNYNGLRSQLLIWSEVLN